MSLAGPHGEAACRYCNTLQDLREDRRLARHAAGPLRNVCKGTGTYAHTQTKEMESLAFSPEPLTRQCPGCSQTVEVSTVAQTRAGWRYSYHQVPYLKDAHGWGEELRDCPGSGTLVGY